MNNLCIDGLGNLSLKLEYIEDDDKRSYFDDWLDFEYRKNEEGVWEVARTTDKVKKLNIAKQTAKVFEDKNIELAICEKLSKMMFTAFNENSYEDAVKNAHKIKDWCSVCNNKWEEHDKAQKLSCQNELQPDISPNFKRKLLPYQKQSVEHLLAIGHGANFSVPGSGKTTITYAALSKWLDDGTINKILVIGPVSSFFPWEDEYKECFGVKDVDKIIVRGKTADDLPDLNFKLTLMHFQTAMRKTQKIIEFMNKEKNDVALIIDESHNIKNIDEGEWVRAVRQISPHAKRRIILSGTPMPRNAADLWVQITFLWPHDKPFQSSGRFKKYTEKHGLGQWKDTLYPLFTRVKKEELGLKKPEFEKYYVDLYPIQSEIYETIAARTLNEIYNFRDRGRIQQFRKAKIIRMLQIASNPTLIHENAKEFSLSGKEFGFGKEKIAETKMDLDSEIYEKIKGYSTCGEIPAKLVQTAKLTKELLKNGEKVLIWSNFITNMKIFENQLLKDENPILIHGDVNPEEDEDDPINRVSLIKKFKNDDNPRVLIATPPSLSEAVSLHINAKEERVCSHAIYLDRNFNGAQFMQSMDRIHRIGMREEDDSSFVIPWEESGEKKEKEFKRNQVYYHFFIANNTIDEIIDDSLWEKYQNMNDALDDNWPNTLDYNGNKVIITENQADNDFKSLHEHLKKLEK